MNFDELVNIVARLRGPDGCPWDREQTTESLIPYLTEEFYELIDAFEHENPDDIREEMGDLLFQIVLQSRLAEEDGKFTISDVVSGIASKMISRHPHVFGDEKIETADDVRKRWKKQKAMEGKAQESILDRVPRSMPALLRARELQLKATKVGFDWDRIDDVFAKLSEEIAELKDAVIKKDSKGVDEEIGDILFVMVRIANFLDVNAEKALQGTIHKFIDRFRYMESRIAEAGKSFSDMTLDEMDVFWNEAKNRMCRK
jgi:tetrapyrrole methylase family protein/MazG family protein